MKNDVPADAAGIDSLPFPPPETWRFADELKQPAPFYFHWRRRVPAAGEADLSRGFRIENHADDPEGLLESAFADLRRFREAAGLPDRGYLLEFRPGDSGPWDSFVLDVGREVCRITAGHREGFRRAVYYLEDLLLSAEGPFLPLGKTRRRCWLKNRITRCFFGPIKRPPMNRDELLDDVDYYPEAYLNRLAHDGANGIWLTVEFQDLCRTRFAPEYGRDAERRLAKLRRTAQKCLRYGIRTFIFCIEPARWREDDPVFRRHPEFSGPERSSCPFSPGLRAYLRESVYEIFRHVPELGGMVNVSYGERTTTCLSTWPCRGSSSGPCARPDCAKKCNFEPADVLYASVSAMQEGMKAASPDAEFISQLYVPFAAPLADWVTTLTERLPAGVTALWNFESGVALEQQGHRCIGGDYWLSAAGPSPRFEKCARKCDPQGAMGAKLQVGCCHETATVPFIPVPGMLYRKYEKMHALKVTTAFQCWYFGSYPGIQTRAAGMLAFEDFTSGEEDFLRRLARIEWGKYAPEVVRCWQDLTAAYEFYPLSNKIQYFGPYHDGPVWPLYPEEQFLPLTPTWKADFPTSGDLIGEIIMPFTIEEITAQAEKLSAAWSAGARQLLKLKKAFPREPERLRDIGVAEALDLLFRSGRNIFRFYLLRSRNRGFTAAMKRIMREEAELSEHLAQLCEADPRLGFHSEAETYKFFPAKLRLRSRILRQYLKTPPETPEVPAAWVCESSRYRKGKSFAWKWQMTETGLKLEIKLDGRYAADQLMLTLAGTCEAHTLNLEFRPDGTFFDCSAADPGNGGIHHTVKRNKNFWKITCYILPGRLPANRGAFRIGMVRLMNEGKIVEKMPDHPGPARYRLNIGSVDPRYMCLMPLIPRPAGKTADKARRGNHSKMS